MMDDLGLDKNRNEFLSEHRSLSVFLTKLAIERSQSMVIKLRLFKMLKHLFGRD